MAEPLTKRQKEIYDFVSQYIEAHGYAPSYREIASAFHFGSVATVAEHIESLVTKGMLQKGENEARSIQLVPQEEFEAQAVTLPIDRDPQPPLRDT
jgi:repressor LexA